MKTTEMFFRNHVGFILLGIVLLPAIFSKAFAQDVSILSQGGNSTTIQVTPDSLGADTLKKGGASYLKLIFKDALTEYNGNGSFVRQFIPIMVGVFSKRIQINVVQANYETLSLLPPVRGSGKFTVTAPQAVSQFISYDSPFEQRRHIVVRVRVYPFSYDSLSGKYQILKKIVFQIISAGGVASVQNVSADRLLSGSLLNYSQVQNAVAAQPSRPQKTSVSSVLASGPWYKLSISKSGIYKLTYQALKNAGVPVDNIQLSTIRIFNNGGTELPEEPNAPRPSDLMENAIYVYNGNTDGSDNFESSDYILFYGKSPREWSYDHGTQTYSYYLNDYTESNFYFMTYGGQAGKRMQSVPSYQASSYDVPQTFTYGIAEEDEITNIANTGKEWYGAPIPPSGSVLYTNTLNGLDQTQPITYTVALVTASTAPNSFAIFENATGNELGTVDGGTINTYGDVEGYDALTIPVQTYIGTGSLPNNTSILKMVYYSSSSSAFGYVYWYEMFYNRKFQAFNDVLKFYAPDTNAAVHYSIQGFSSNNIKVFDVSDFENVAMVQDSTNNNTASLGIQALAGASKQFYAVGDNGYLSVDSISSVQNSNLRGQVAADSLDLIIVTPPDFLTQANQLAAFKQSFDGLKTMVVTTSSIYNEFGCGIPDPTAIRDFLKYAYNNCPKTPSYVILFGGGSYDYKNIVVKTPDYIPPYETEESLNAVSSFTTDDYFVEFDTTISSLQSPISMSIGRLPGQEHG